MKKILLCLSFACLATASHAQSTYTEWAAQGRPDFTLNGDEAPANALGGLTTFPDLASFMAASTTVTETFDGGATGPGVVNTCTEPVNSASNDVCFAPGDLLDGFSMTSSGGGGIVVLGATFLGANQTSPVAGANTFADTTIVTFSPAVTAVAMDTLIGAPGPGDVTITAMDAGAATIGSVTVTTVAVDSTVFAGFTSVTPIASIVIDGVGGSGELMDNLYFGTAGGPPPPPAVAVPALSNWGITLLAGLLLLAMAIITLRRRA